VNGNAVAPATTAAPTTTAGAPAFVRVPDVRGMRPNRATDVLRAAGLRVAQQNVPTANRKQQFRVIQQLPLGGQRVARDTTVTIYVGVPIDSG